MPMTLRPHLPSHSNGLSGVGQKTWRQGIHGIHGQISGCTKRGQTSGQHSFRLSFSLGLFGFSVFLKGNLCIKIWPTIPSTFPKSMATLNSYVLRSPATSPADTEQLKRFAWRVAASVMGLSGTKFQHCCKNPPLTSFKESLMVFLVSDLDVWSTTQWQ